MTPTSAKRNHHERRPRSMVARPLRTPPVTELALRPCPSCGEPAILATTGRGEPVVLDPERPVFRVVDHGSMGLRVRVERANGTAMPGLGAGYAPHVCPFVEPVGRAADADLAGQVTTTRDGLRAIAAGLAQRRPRFDDPDHGALEIARAALRLLEAPEIAAAVARWTAGPGGRVDG